MKITRVFQSFINFIVEVQMLIKQHFTFVNYYYVKIGLLAVIVNMFRFKLRWSVFDISPLVAFFLHVSRATICTDDLNDGNIKINPKPFARASFQIFLYPLIPCRRDCTLYFHIECSDFSGRGLNYANSHSFQFSCIFSNPPSMNNLICKAFFVIN